MNGDFFDALDLLEKEKGIPKKYMLDRVEAALKSAYKKQYDGRENVLIRMDEDRRVIQMYQVMTAVEEVKDPITEILVSDAQKYDPAAAAGSTVERAMDPSAFHRLSAQNGKQVIRQGIREAERGMIIKEYENKREEIISATVIQVDPVYGNAILEINGKEMTLMKADQIPGEVLHDGQIIKVFVSNVMADAAGPSGPVVSLSRVNPGLVKRLFELEVPEIQEGIVIIKGITREAGSRTKMSVMSRDENVDPIGACIGAHNIRSNAILAELAGEKVDIIKYSDDMAEYIKAALSPAKVNSVVLEDGEKACRVYVDADQLSLAIGKEGQNARLAAHLTGYKIDIKTDDLK